MAEDEKSPIERLIETAVFAPLGIAAMIREELPKLVSRGHQEANMAKMMGQFAVGMGRQEVEKRLKQYTERPAPNAAKPPAATPPPAPAPSSRPHPRHRATRACASCRDPVRQRHTGHGSRRAEPGHPGLRQPVGVTGGAAPRRAEPGRARGDRLLRSGRSGPAHDPEPGRATSRRVGPARDDRRGRSCRHCARRHIRRRRRDHRDGRECGGHLARPTRRRRDARA